VVVGNGGLGQLIFSGFNNNLYRAEIFTATAMCVLLALTADALLLGLEKVLTPWARR
jgi:osmoprotectant transport system permease protein